MKFTCSYCHLRMQSSHFENVAYCYSICDICDQRGIDAEQYCNNQINLYASVSNKMVIGNSESTIDGGINLKQRKQLESLIAGYDTNELVKHQLRAPKFYQAIIDFEDGKFDFELCDHLPKNLHNLKLDVNFDLYEIDFVTREQVRKKYNYICQYCGRYGDSVDHMDPVSLSGNNSFENLTLSCEECNQIKGDMPYKEFMRLNQRIEAINIDLVQYEQQLLQLTELFKKNRGKLSGLAHHIDDIKDPRLVVLRQQSKDLQMLIDSMSSDYNVLREQRKQYFEINWQIDNY